MSYYLYMSESDLSNSPKLMTSVHSNYSSDDISREEMKWDQRTEQLLNEWLEQAMKASELHKITSRKYKRLYKYTGTPAIVIPLAVSAVTTLMSPLTLTGLSLVAGVASGINQINDYSGKAQEHIQASNKYNSLCNEIKMVLSKPRRLREPCDVYLMRTMKDLNRLDFESPDYGTAEPPPSRNRNIENN